MPAAAKQALAEAKAALAEKASTPGEPKPELQREHPIIASTRKALGRPRADDNGFVGLSGRGLVQMKIGPASVERSIAWLAEMLLLLRQQAGDFQAIESGAAFLLAGESIPFRIEEKPERTPHVPTKAELARKADRLRWGGYSADPWPKYDHSPSGRLSVVLEANSYSGLRRTFGDGSTQRLETMTPDIVAALAAHAALIKERRQEAEAARKAAEIAEQKRRRLAAFGEREGRRQAFVDLVADKLEERARMRAVLDHIGAADPAERDRLDAMAAWLRRKLAETEARIGPVFLDLSARSAKIEFDEAVQEGEGQRWYYPRDPELSLWSLDHEKDSARTQSSLEWAREAGHLCLGLEAEVGD